MPSSKVRRSTGMNVLNVDSAAVYRYSRKMTAITAALSADS
jgi:tRNA A37 N6-isopentenylltransferase MiaA